MELMISDDLIDEVFKESTTKILKIGKKIKDKEPEIEYSKRWFRTKFGKELFAQIKELEVRTWKLFSLTFPIGKLILEIANILENPEAKEEIKKSREKNENISDKFLTDLLEEHGPEILRSFVNQGATENFFFDKTDLFFFSAVVAISLYAYVENYLQRIIEELFKNKMTEQPIVEYIQKNRKINLSDIEEEKRFQTIIDNFPTNPLKKTKIILKIFQLNNRFSRLRSNLSLSKYYESFKGFTRVRHKLAHRVPILKEELISHTSQSLLRYTRKYSEMIFKQIGLEGKHPEYTQEVQNIVIDWFHGIVFPISALYTFLHSTIVVTTLFDQIIFNLMRIV
ncbi:MAG: hypothetical protein ACTSP3_14945 [Candidatus Heimdallarchaeaceae archaeon]